jgi:hypothetical protein
VTRALSCFILFATLLLAVPGGQYVGTWTSDSGANSGKVNITLSGANNSDLSFTYQDQVVKPQKVTANVHENQVEFICELDMEGLKLKTAFLGTVDGKSMAGKYQSTSRDDGSVVDSGTWKATQQ